jgi:hypothetical protein
MGLAASLFVKNALVSCQESFSASLKMQRAPSFPICAWWADALNILSFPSQDDYADPNHEDSKPFSNRGSLAKEDEREYYCQN